MNNIFSIKHVRQSNNKMRRHTNNQQSGRYTNTKVFLINIIVYGSNVHANKNVCKKLHVKYHIIIEVLIVFWQTLALETMPTPPPVSVVSMIPAVDLIGGRLG